VALNFQYEIAKIAALLHRAADMSHVPAMKETKFLLPKPALTVRDIKPTQWVNMVQSNWVDVQAIDAIQAKAQVLGKKNLSVSLTIFARGYSQHMEWKSKR